MPLVFEEPAGAPGALGGDSAAFQPTHEVYNPGDLFSELLDPETVKFFAQCVMVVLIGYYTFLFAAKRFSLRKRKQAITLEIEKPDEWNPARDGNPAIFSSEFFVGAFVSVTAVSKDFAEHESVRCDFLGDIDVAAVDGTAVTAVGSSAVAAEHFAAKFGPLRRPGLYRVAYVAEIPSKPVEFFIKRYIRVVPPVLRLNAASSMWKDDVSVTVITAHAHSNRDKLLLLPHISPSSGSNSAASFYGKDVTGIDGADAASYVWVPVAPTATQDLLFSGSGAPQQPG